MRMRVLIFNFLGFQYSVSLSRVFYFLYILYMTFNWHNLILSCMICYIDNAWVSDISKILTFYAIILTLLLPPFPPDHANKNFKKYDMIVHVMIVHVITFYLDSRKAVKNSAQKVVVISTSHCIRDGILGNQFNKSFLVLKNLTQKSVKQENLSLFMNSIL